MATSISLPTYQYKEIRVNLESSTPGANVLLRLPSPSVTHRTWGSHAVQRRPLPLDIPIAEDERIFRQKHLASSASIYHRQHHHTPRSFLWRVLEDGKVLAIRVVDLSKHDKAADYNLTLRLHLAANIRPNCIALSDSMEHDTLAVFILTEDNQLYTLTLRPDFFLKRSATEDNVADWCKTYQPIALSTKHPHRLIALSSREVIVTLHDAGFLRLSKQQGSHGAVWEENHYNQGGWAGLTSLVAWRGSTTIVSNGFHMELTALASVAVPTVEIAGASYLFSVSLGHKLKIWNLDTRKLAYDEDLLGIERAPNEIASFLIQPTFSNLVRVCPDVGAKIVVVVYSPAGVGQFRFMTIERQSNGALDLQDIDDTFQFVPLPPTADIWTLVDFTAVADKQTRGRLSLWVLWKNNLTYRVQKVSFAIDASDDARIAWNGEWAAVSSETLNDTPLPLSLPTDVEDPAQKWLNFILFPGRFTTATIETALVLYEKGVGGARNSVSKSTKNLAERICCIVTSTTSLGKTFDSMDYDGFRTANDVQWRRFFRLILELDKQRGEGISLCYDLEHDIATVVTADGLGVVRECSQIEKVWHNADVAIPDLQENINVLISAAAAFSDSMSDELLNNCKRILRAELFHDATSTSVSRLVEYYNNCGFAGQISEEDFDQLVRNLGGNFKPLNEHVYDAFFHAMISGDDVDDRLEQLPLAELGMKTVTRGVQEFIELHESLCFDQLVLLAFIEGEVDKLDYAITIDTGAMYTRILELLRRLHLLSFLCKTRICPTSSRSDPKPTTTAFAGSLSHLLGFITHSGTPASNLLTDLIIRICCPDSEYVLQPALIQCYLLKEGRADLAREVAFFMGKDTFSCYVMGRVCLETGEVAEAGEWFRKAAPGMARPTSKSVSQSSSGLLSDTERALLHAGLPRYCSHVVALFESQKAYSHIIEFSRLALQFTKHAHAKNDVETSYTEGLKLELQNRMFNAALQTQKFEVAYATLMLISSGDNEKTKAKTLQSTLLKQLVIRMAEQGSSNRAQLLSFPFLGVSKEVEGFLWAKAIGSSDTTLHNTSGGASGDRLSGSSIVPWHWLLYSFRIQRGDFKGAAEVSLAHLRILHNSTNDFFDNGTTTTNQKNGIQTSTSSDDALETPITKQYLTLINTLSCLPESEAWVFEKVQGGGSNGKTTKKRRVTTLADIRREYMDELDRIAAVENGHFAFGDDEKRDEEEEGEGNENGADVEML